MFQGNQISRIAMLSLMAGLFGVQAIAAYGFYRSQGGRPLFREEILSAGG